MEERHCEAWHCFFVSDNVFMRYSLIHPFYKIITVAHDVHESMHRDTTMTITNKMHYIDEFIIPSRLALHVSGDVFAHHREHLTVFTVSGGVCCRPAAGSNLGEHHQIL